MDSNSQNPESQVTVLMEDDSPLKIQGGLGCSDSRNSEGLTENLELQFQHIPVSPMQVDKIKRVREAIELFTLALACESLLKSPT